MDRGLQTFLWRWLHCHLLVALSLCRAQAATMLWRRRCTTGKNRDLCQSSADLSGGERFHVPLISRNQNEQVDESEEAVVDSYHSGDEAGQSPYDQHGRGQREVVFAAGCFNPLARKGRSARNMA